MSIAKAVRRAITYQDKRTAKTLPELFKRIDMLRLQKRINKAGHALFQVQSELEDFVYEMELFENKHEDDDGERLPAKFYDVFDALHDTLEAAETASDNWDVALDNLGPAKKALFRRSKKGGK